MQHYIHHQIYQKKMIAQICEICTKKLVGSRTSTISCKFTVIIVNLVRVFKNNYRLYQISGYFNDFILIFSQW